MEVDASAFPDIPTEYLEGLGDDSLPNFDDVGADLSDDEDGNVDACNSDDDGDAETTEVASSAGAGGTVATPSPGSKFPAAASLCALVPALVGIVHEALACVNSGIGGSLSAAVAAATAGTDAPAPYDGRAERRHRQGVPAAAVGAAGGAGSPLTPEQSTAAIAVVDGCAPVALVLLAAAYADDSVTADIAAAHCCTQWEWPALVEWVKSGASYKAAPFKADARISAHFLQHAHSLFVDSRPGVASGQVYYASARTADSVRS
jgi:hypothetical protein